MDEEVNPENHSPFIQERLRGLRAAFAFRRTLTPETDRGCALIVGAYLDSELAKLLEANFVEDSGVLKQLASANGPIGSFASRIDLSFAMGLIAKQDYRDLHLIRKIRNEFAHAPSPLSFDDKPISQRCHELVDIVAGEAARERFCSCSMRLLSAIHSAIATSTKPVVRNDIEVTREMGEEVRAQSHKQFLAALNNVGDSDADALQRALETSAEEHHLSELERLFRSFKLEGE